jgi:hypothetical protein
MTQPAKPVGTLGPSLSQDARPADDGVSEKSIRVAILGAGSAVFAQRLIADLLSMPAQDQGT